MLFLLHHSEAIRGRLHVQGLSERHSPFLETLFIGKVINDFGDYLFINMADARAE